MLLVDHRVLPDDPIAQDVGRVAVLLVTVAFEGALIAVALLVGPLVNANPLSLIHWDSGDVLWGVAVAAATFVMVVTSVEANVSLFRSMTKAIEEIVERLFTRCTVIDLAVVAILAGVGEELMFRGVIQQALTPAVGWGFALVVTSLIFGAAHMISVSYFWYATSFGLAAGALFLATGNLIAPIIAHVVYDFVALVYLVRRNRRRHVMTC